jgi:four helix bundle protein
MSTAKKFEELEIWKMSREIVKIIYIDLKDSRDYGFRDQICRCAVSIMNNIAEGFERNSTNEFIRFLIISKGSCGELKSMLYICEDLNLISESEILMLKQKTEILLVKIGGMIKYLKSLKKS